MNFHAGIREVERSLHARDAAADDNNALWQILALLFLGWPAFSNPAEAGRYRL
jgi:hypothetical protein